MENNVAVCIAPGLNTGRKTQKMAYLSSPTLLWCWYRQTALNWWTRRAVRRAPKFRFLRYDGEAFELDCQNCTRCKNYWFVRRADIELPLFCPYCGVRFEGAALISNAAMTRHQV